jgi:hypothetical protein
MFVTLAQNSNSNGCFPLMHPSHTWCNDISFMFTYWNLPYWNGKVFDAKARHLRSNFLPHLHFPLKPCHWIYLFIFSFCAFTTTILVKLHSQAFRNEFDKGNEIIFRFWKWRIWMMMVGHTLFLTCIITSMFLLAIPSKIVSSPMYILHGAMHS